MSEYEDEWINGHEINSEKELRVKLRSFLPFEPFHLLKRGLKQMVFKSSNSNKVYVIKKCS